MSYDTITAEARPAQPIPAVATGTNGMAVAGFVLGLLWLGGLGSLLAVVFGAMGRKQTRATGQGGSGLATAGLILGIVGLVGTLLWIVLIVVAAGSAVSAADAYSSCVNAAQTVVEASNC
jgi:hypothetical protein